MTFFECWFKKNVSGWFRDHPTRCKHVTLTPLGEGWLDGSHIDGLIAVTVWTRTPCIDGQRSFYRRDIVVPLIVTDTDEAAEEAIRLYDDAIALPLLEAEFRRRELRQ